MLMKTYKFMKDGKQINSAVAVNEEDAMKICGLEKGDFDSVEAEADNSPPPPEKPKRKTRTDKGSKKKEKKVKSRRKPEYFIYNGSELSQALNHDEATKAIEEALPENVRIIMGHEISFTRKVSFHF